jgi:hypothetical protein
METIATKETALSLAVGDFNQQFENESTELKATISKTRTGNTFQQVLGIGSEILNIVSMGKSSSIINSIKTIAGQIYSAPTVSNYVSTLNLNNAQTKSKIGEITKEGYNNYLFMKQFFVGIERDRSRINNWLLDINLYNESVKIAQESLDSLKINYFLLIKKELPKNLKTFNSPAGKKEKETYVKIIDEYFKSLKLEDVKGNLVTEDKTQLLADLTNMNKLIIEFESRSLFLKNRLNFSFENFMYDFNPTYNPFAAIKDPSPKTLEVKAKYDSLKAAANENLVNDFKKSLEALLK